MKLDTSLGTDALAALGTQAVDLLCNGDIDALARRFGYALSYGREAATAIKEDLRHALSQVGALELAVVRDRPMPNVKYFDRNSSSNVRAVVECLAPTDNGAMLLVELVVTCKGAEEYITLEDISVSNGNIVDPLPSGAA